MSYYFSQEKKMKFGRKNLLIYVNKKTVQTMISMYCRVNHNKKEKVSGKLCRDCLELEQYALLKLRRCPYGENKPNCPHCPVHCYSQEKRERISLVMRYSGPRMVLKHPILSTYHLYNKFRKNSLEIRKGE
jgi:Nitrous oxide-stimulated promoter